MVSRRVTLKGSGAAMHRFTSTTMSLNSSRTKYKTGVSLEPEIARSLDELVAMSGLNRSWVLNAIVRDYLRYMPPPYRLPLASREAVIQIT